MISEAVAYLATRTIVRREPLYSARRFARFVSDIPASDVTTEHLKQCREALSTLGFSHRTIESTVADIVTVVTATTGRTIAIGSRLPVLPPEPQPVPLETLDAMIPHCPAWLRGWLAVGLWTGLRVSDSLRICGRPVPSETLRYVASKTGKRHVWPVPEWLRREWPREFPLSNATDAQLRHLRDCIVNACDAADVALWHPKQLRQRAVTEWSRANSTAGALVHGTGIGILRHYVDPLCVLEAAAPRVRLPACFGDSSAADRETVLIGNYRRLDPAAQELVSGMTERLTG